MYAAVGLIGLFGTLQCSCSPTGLKFTSRTLDDVECHRIHPCGQALEAGEIQHRPRLVTYPAQATYPAAEYQHIMGSATFQVTGLGTGCQSLQAREQSVPGAGPAHTITPTGSRQDHR